MLSEFEEARKKRMILDLNNMISDQDELYYCPTCEGSIFKLQREPKAIECIECGQHVELGED